MIEQLSKRDQEWRLIARKICGNQSLADDIVQDMYLAIYKAQPKAVNSSYIYRTIQNLYINHIKSSPTNIEIEEHHLKSFENDGFTDKELEILDKASQLKWHQKEFIKESYDRSYREIDKEYNISYAYIYRESKKALREVLGDEYDTLYNNTRRKNGKTKGK